MKILLSPAKSITETDRKSFPLESVPMFLSDSSKLVNKLKKIPIDDLMNLMHVSKDLAALNRDRFRSWKKPEKQEGVIQPCSFIFSGEVYRALEMDTFSDSDLIKAQDQLFILSGLYGILRPLDLIYPYRLEMGTKWSPNEKSKNLYGFWNQKLTKHLNSSLTKEEVIIDLASSEYSKVIDWKKVKNRVVTPQFKEFKNGEYKVVMMYAKHARGLMARYLIQNELEDIEQLKGYDQDGYTYDDTLSNEKEWVFVR